eukprot:NODE_209_length_14693_cov_0.335617.p8 type:complete len:115 gc:universal NODE_209_length_14693_cov_0.335617:2514-2170(-)
MSLNEFPPYCIKSFKDDIYIVYLIPAQYVLSNISVKVEGRHLILCGKLNSQIRSCLDHSLPINTDTEVFKNVDNDGAFVRHIKLPNEMTLRPIDHQNPAIINKPDCIAVCLKSS